MSTTNIHILQFKTRKSLVKTRSLNAGTSGLTPKRNRLIYITLHSPFAFYKKKTTTTTTTTKIKKIKI